MKNSFLAGSSLLVAVALAEEPTCGDHKRDGVFFSKDDFRDAQTRSNSEPGTFANHRSSPDELRQRVSAWRTPYTNGPLSHKEHTQFFDDGFVVVHGILPESALHEAIRSVEGLVDDLADRLFLGGLINETFATAGFYERLTLIERAYPHASVLLHKHGVLPRGIQKVWSHPNLMQAAVQILGTDVDIYGHPVWNLRCKTPEEHSAGQATVPWHQDNAYLDEESWDRLQLTAWVPLLDANVSNGCMQVVRGAHRPGGTVAHACCVGGTWYVETTPEEIEAALGADMERDVVTCEVPFGSVLLLNNLVPHRSLPNYSPSIRWSLDLRWQRGGEPNGFGGIKPSLLMQRGGEGGAGREFDFGEWAAQDRTEAQKAAAQARTASPAGATGDDAPAQGDGVVEAAQTGGVLYDTTIAGPWMRRWPLIHQNRHTVTLGDGGASSRDA